MKSHIIEVANKFNLMGRIRELQTQLMKFKESLQAIAKKNPPQQ